MPLSTWLAFLSISLIACFSPGPGLLLAISNTMGQGTRRALISSSGNAVGICIVAAIATLGLGALLKTSATLFVALKIAGAGYLVYLGVRQWFARGVSMTAAPIDGIAPAAKPASRLFREGLVVALTNPKTILFFTALFPQFMRSDGSPIEQFAVLTGTFVACSVISHTVFVVLAQRARRWFESERGVRRLNRGAGALFVLLGLGLLGLRRTPA